MLVDGFLDRTVAALAGLLPLDMGTSLLGIGYLESRNPRDNPVQPASYYAAPIVCKSRIRAGPEPRGTCRSGERIMVEGRVGWFSPPRRPAPTIALRNDPDSKRTRWNPSLQKAAMRAGLLEGPLPHRPAWFPDALRVLSKSMAVRIGYWSGGGRTGSGQSAPLLRPLR